MFTSVWYMIIFEFQIIAIKLFTRLRKLGQSRIFFYLQLLNGAQKALSPGFPTSQLYVGYSHLLMYCYSWPKFIMDMIPYPHLSMHAAHIPWALPVCQALWILSSRGRRMCLEVGKTAAQEWWLDAGEGLHLWISVVRPALSGESKEAWMSWSCP